MKSNKPRPREIVSDCLMTVGAIAVSIGIGLIHIASGIIAGGVLAVLYGWLIAKGCDAS